MMEDHDDNFDTDEFSSSSNPSARSSCFTSVSLSDSDTDGGNIAPKNAKSKAVTIQQLDDYNIDDYDSDKRLGITKQYDRAYQEKQKAKARIKNKIW